MVRRLLILALFATSFGAFGLERVAVATAGVSPQEQVCDVAADSSLGRENYSQAIRLHQQVIAAHPDDALAHYHLGFAYGMVGQPAAELTEYRKAAELGLQQWDLYVNLGRVYLEGRDYPAATAALLIAVSLGPKHSEAHFNLGLAYERQMRLPQAEQELRTALRLGADRAEAGNMLAVVCAEEGHPAEARRIWTDLTHSQPASTVAQTNLAILDQHEKSAASVPLTTVTVASAQLRP